MRVYRGKPQFTSKDVAGNVDTMRKLGIFPERSANGVYITELARKLYGSDSKENRIKTNGRLQYWRKKGLVVNVRYGYWMYVNQSLTLIF